jgi:Tfp pilus assembly protein PilF
MWRSILALLAVTLAASPVSAADLTEGTRALYRGDFEAAAQQAEEFLKLHPRAAAAQILLARAHIAQGRAADSYQELLTAIQWDPKNVDALYYLGRVCLILSQQEYRQLFAMAPDSFRVHQILAETYAARQDTASAEEEYKAALKVNPRAVEILDALGGLKRSSFKFDEAATYYSRALAISPQDYEAAYGLGACALFQNQEQQALGHLRRALEIDPRSAPARLALGDALLRTGQSAAAIRELKTAVSLEPAMRQAYTLLARAYRQVGQPQAAEAALKKEQELAREQIEDREKALGSGTFVIPPGAPTQRPPSGGPKR